MQTRLDGLFLELVRWTQDPTIPEAFEKALKVIALAMVSAGVSDSVANEVITMLRAPALKTKVLTTTDPPMRLAALWTTLYEALESVVDRCEVVKEWIAERHWIQVNARPPVTVLPPYPGDNPRRRN